MKTELNLRHLRQLIAVCDNGLSVSAAAASLKVAQSVVSRNIQALEEHFGAPLFIRHGRRLTGLTPLCTALMASLRDIDASVSDLRAISEEVLKQPMAGEIRIACTHLQARYILPTVLTQVRKKHPEVSISIHQCFPPGINEMIMANSADLGICSERLSDAAVLGSVDAYKWERVLVAPRGHPLLERKTVTLESLCRVPLVTYVRGITGRQQFDERFISADLYPNVVVAAADSDVIKQFTREGHGVGVISEIAYQPKADRDLAVRLLSDLFRPMKSRVVYRQDRNLSSAQQQFIETFCEVSNAFAKAARRAVS